MRRILASLVLLSTLSAAGGAAAQHFDCGKAYFADEKLICHDHLLQQLDQDLTGLYLRRMEQLSDDERDALQSAEVNWVRNRRRCGNDYDCVAQSYRSRMRQFEATRSDEDIGSPQKSFVPPSREEAAAAKHDWERRGGPGSRPKAGSPQRRALSAGEAPMQEGPVSSNVGPAATGSSEPEPSSPQERGIAVAPMAPPPATEPQPAERKNGIRAREKKHESRSGEIKVTDPPATAEPPADEQNARTSAHNKRHAKHSGETNVTAAPPAAEPQPAEQTNSALAPGKKREEKKATERHSHRTGKAAAPPAPTADSDQRSETPVANASAGSGSPPKTAPPPAAGDNRPSIRWVDPNPAR